MKALRQKWLSLPPSLRWSLIILFYLSLIGGYLLWQYQRPSGAALYGHNHTDRPIFSYWVNDNWGGNGGVTCCWRIRGEVLEVSWIVSRTRAQLEQGLEEEHHKLKLPNPPRQREDHYLHVHFFPDNQVRLAWSSNHDSPYEHLVAAPTRAKERQ